MWDKITFDGFHNVYSTGILDKYNTRISISTDDDKNIAYILFGRPSSMKNQWFFDDNEPGGCLLNGRKFDVWPGVRPPVVVDRYKPSFIELGKQVPSLKGNLEKCVAFLEQPGPNYDPKNPPEESTIEV